MPDAYFSATKIRWILDHVPGAQAVSYTHLEMHPDPLHARCDGAQALLPEELAALSQRLHTVREACR